MNHTVFLTHIISHWQKMPKRKLYNGFHVDKIGIRVSKFSKNCIFPNIQLKGVVNRLPPFKSMYDHMNKFLMR